ncbi:glucose-6-phosphate isomerase [Marinirhabdus gelatinilytica]|uniref:Glucose-6-phosphate isomerase n=1 Tax=Marinirhabdus gelatinilytica TaxID=1703343 RepID=A0A370QG38_9FLAO|nr:glucose-6-phosphate isomerase [Marinirhabdus gelatinilytica]RDK87010.1 glucose-6-phosphate isomerase [Marinirhabdus gelatinilytica]
MPLPKIDPTSTKAWKALQTHFNEMREVDVRDLFAENPARATDFSISWNDFFVDISKNRITPKTRELLLQLADEVALKSAIEAQFQGEKINETEDRAVLHTALRDFSNMKPEVAEGLQKMKAFSEAIHNKTYKGYTGKPIDTVVNIGIGGSHLGPEMVCTALQDYNKGINVHFISNIDGDAVARTLQQVDPETTLFIVVSKTFTTQETLTNAHTVKDWFVDRTNKTAVAQHFIAVSTNPEEVAAFGILAQNTFAMWDWVGGRFSLWSAVGLSICCAIGYTNFETMLKGAHGMDQHFATAPFSENIPVALAMLSIWYNNFYGFETEAIIPYSEALNKLVPYLQQAVMESNGKQIDRNGNLVDYQTGTIVWGATGTNAQHAFFQLLHQGTKRIPTDFICVSQSNHGLQEHHDILVANCLAQSEALLEGKPAKSGEPYRTFKGNKPTTTILIEKLTPKNLGSLIALYEHKTFVQGVVWNMYSYDQWGVELGKSVAKTILQAIREKDESVLQNKSTRAIFKKVKK